MKVLLVPSGNEKVLASARYLAARLIAAGVDTVVQPAGDRVAPIVSVDEIALVVPMGGDGTFLQAAHLMDFAPTPLLGLNYGNLGFLSGSPERDEVELVTDALSGDITFERRSTLDATVKLADGSVVETTALNELTYTRGASGNIVEFSYAVNGIGIAHLRADGLIVATATGSTAYALSAGGPIVSPGYSGLVVVPVAPHSLRTRALVLAPSDVLEVSIEGKHRCESQIFVDGELLACEDPASIIIRRGTREVFFARGGGDFFSNVSRVFFGGPVGGFDA